MELPLFYCGMAVSAWLFLVGLYGITTSKHLVHQCLCLVVLQAATYVMLTAIGYRPGLPAPVFVDQMPPGGPAVDAVVQALMLTDIVVEATVVALLLAITIQIHKRGGTADPNAVNVLHG